MSTKKHPPPAYVPLIHDLFKGPTAEEASRALRGRGSDPAQQAVLAIIRYTREDVLNALTSIELDERQRAYLAGEAHILRELEAHIVNAHTLPIEG